MISIDKFAYINRLRNTHPVEKFSFAVITLAITVASHSLILPTLVFFVMSAAVLLAARIPVFFYGKLLLLPVFFLAAGAFSVAVNAIPEEMIFSVVILEKKIGVSQASLHDTGRLFMKAMGSVSCLYFLILTVPVTEIINILKKIKVPVLFLELLMIVYKYIFILLETMNRIYVSQNSRLGYRNFKVSFRSLGKLVASIFAISLKKYEDMYNALESRCFTGNFHFYQRKYAHSKLNIGLIVLCEGILMTVNVIFWGKM